MGRRKSNLPEVGKRMIRGAWSVHWWWNGKMFSIAAGVSGKEMEESAEAVRRAISSAIAAGVDFPPPFNIARAAVRYREARYGVIDTSANAEVSANWLADYEREIFQECIEDWAKANISMLKALDAEIGGLKNATTKNLSHYLAGIAERNSISTRNRTRNAFSRFYGWAKRTGRITDNPVAAIPTLTEPRITDIIYCTPAERDKYIRIARSTETKEWIAIPIAFFSGMRREEIAKMQWPDVRLAEGSITVVETKTKTSRTLPLNSTLEEYLCLIPENERHGHVVQSDYEDRVAALVALERRMKRIVTATFKQCSPAPRKPRKGCKNFDMKFAEYKRQYGEWEKPLSVDIERIGWNSFRHTFGSLLAQAGVSLDKISAWMGNTPEVCRRHYAQFIPRDRRDAEIDKL